MTEFIQVPGFKALYQVQFQPELPSGSAELHRFGPAHNRGPQEVLLRVQAGQRDWCGAFRAGDGGQTFAMATPSPSHLLLVSGGQGYLVHASNPTATVLLSVYPIRGARAIPEAAALVCVDDTDMLLLDKAGVKWVSRRIASDGLRITEADANGIRGLAWSAFEDKEVDFFVDLATGVVHGGIPPEA